MNNINSEVKEYRIVCLDFACTLAINDTYPYAGQPNLVAIEILKAYRKKGNKLILWTCRTGFALEEAVKMCKAHDLEFDAINDNIKEATASWRELNPGVEMSRKVYAEMYIDDRDPHAILYGIDWDAVSRLLLGVSLEEFKKMRKL